MRYGGASTRTETFSCSFQKRSKRERQVRKLRDEISEKKTLITTVTKGIPFAKIEVRPQDQLPKHSGPLSGEQNPLLSSTAVSAIIAAGLSSTPTPFGNLLSSSSPAPMLSGTTPLPPSTLPGLANNQLIASNGSSLRPPAYMNGPPPGISPTAAAAAAARLAKDEETEDEDPAAQLSRLTNSHHAIQIN